MISTIVWLINAIVMPWATGALLLILIFGLRTDRVRVKMDASPAESPALTARLGSALYLAGAAYLMGQVLVMALLYAAFVVTGSSHARGICILLIFLVAFGGYVVERLSRLHTTRNQQNAKMAESMTRSRHRPIVWRRLIADAKPLYIFLALLLAIKLVVMTAATLGVPIRGDDAISIWLYRAKVIAALDAMPLDPAHPYYLGGSIPTYPVYCSLMAAWIPLVTGEWHESQAAIPWLLTYLSVICIVAGGLLPRCGPMVAWLAAYAVASLPLMAIHVCRPGYADLPLAAFLVAAVLQLLAWRRSGRMSDFVLAVVFATAAALMKREGPALAILAVGPILLCSFPIIRATSAKSSAWVAAVLAAAVLLCAILLDFSDQHAAFSQLAWQQGVAAALVRHAIEWGSFSILFPIGLVSLVVIALRRDADHRAATVITCLLLIGFVAGIFLLTPLGRFALNDQTPSRLLLQVAPTLIVLMASSLGAWCHHGTGCKS